MNTKGFGSAVFVHVAAGLLTIAASGALADEPNRAVADQGSGQSSRLLTQDHLAQNLVENRRLAQSWQLAQTVETGCRQVNVTTGVYAQPSLDSSSRSILSSGQTVQLELIGTGTGWARITAPVIGWIEAKYLTPMTACTGITATPQAIQPTQATPGTITGTAARTVTVMCEVLPNEGLVVRSEPTTTGNTALYTIPKGVHQFQFTNDHLRSHSGNLQRYWAYITAPYQGWISLGIVGGSFNLGGRECG
jgi:hypothetical protein